MKINGKVMKSNGKLMKQAMRSNENNEKALKYNGN